MRGNAWTEERIETLKHLWDTGSSAAEIAAELGGLTRNAVLGKIFRLGLSESKVLRAEKMSRAIQKSWEKRPRQSVRAELPPKMSAETVQLRCAEIIPRNVSLYDLAEDDCKYPYGEGCEITFCGHPSVVGRSYCGPHSWLTADVSKRSRAERETFRRGSRAEHKQKLLEAAE
ncbi:GcrA family cell cycle regulator [Bradyrhizobium icense]|uniref:Global cell cycle regulator GcrA-like protein n=1 Tax=Bradyrhizobium icense TaxID=1274631 RepID=A0A1B1UD17_9BRAD|nr:GcrA family cell cycle regulator [Bradyrhizobium icense]ANW00670.1 hypothetical protein LMTR13_11325 [Bradyrhizobium icense]